MSTVIKTTNVPTYYMASQDTQVRAMFGLRGFERVFEPDKADFVIFTGGADVSPFLYGEPRHSKTVTSFTRDLQDITTLRKCGHNQVKIGICRGAQFLNVMLGNGRLYQHVEGHATAGGHTAKETYDGGREFLVSSTHHQMMIPGSSGKVLLAAAKSLSKETASTTIYRQRNLADKNFYDDPEAVIYQDYDTFCFQPHPEYTGALNKDCRDYFFETIACYWLSNSQEKALAEAAKTKGAPSHLV